MAGFSSPFLQAMQERAFLHQCTDEGALDAALQKGPVVAYIGFDCTARSLHVGSLVQIMMLRWLQKTGHKPIVLLGGGTSKVGDPSGKDESRQLLRDKDIAANMAGIQQIFSVFLDFEEAFDAGNTAAVLVNNAEWLEGLNYIDFLRDYGRHFSVNRMLSFDSVKLRLDREHHLSFLEFNYMILQAYDFVELFNRYGCTLQMGGSDQWGNIVNGVELARRMEKGPLFGLTTPLITTASGAKMGKTAQGAVWLNAEMTSPYEYWQFWRNTEDGDVGRFLRLFTELPLEEIARLEALEGAEINTAKIALANAATALCHGEAAAREAEETAHKTFAEGGMGEDLPTITVDKAKVAAGMEITALLQEAGLAESKSAARRLIQGGGARLNGERITEETQQVTECAFAEGDLKLSAGKKRHAIVKLA